MKGSSTRKVRQPETLHQARQVEARARRLRAHGVGPVCSERLAFASQEGAAPVDPPCAACLFPVEQLGGRDHNGWRVRADALDGPPALPQDMPAVLLCLPVAA